MKSKALSKVVHMNSSIRPALTLCVEQTEMLRFGEKRGEINK